MTTGVYSQSLRSLVHHDHQRVILEFWANDIALSLGPQLVLDYLGNPGSMTACHNVANTLVEKAGTGILTTLVSNQDDMSSAVDAVRNGGYVMEIKFHKDHSVLLFSTVEDTDVEILEGWAGGGRDNDSVEPYMFIKSVYESHEAGRIPKDDAADALEGAAAGRNLNRNVGRLTRCVATGCGIGTPGFKVTVKYRQLDNINMFSATARQEVKEYTRRISEIVYDDRMRKARGTKAPPSGYRCRLCFKEMPSARSPEDKWHYCKFHKEVYCSTCALHLRPSLRSRGGLGRYCSKNDTMTRF